MVAQTRVRRSEGSKSSYWERRVDWTPESLGQCLTVSQSQHPIREVQAPVSQQGILIGRNWINSRLTISSSTQLIPMLKTCPYFLRGQFRQCFQVAARKISCKLRRRCKSSARLEIVCLGADDDVADQVAMDLLEEVSWSTERTGGRSWFTMPHNTNSRKVHRSECSQDEECERRGKAT